MLVDDEIQTIDRAGAISALELAVSRLEGFIERTSDGLLVRELAETRFELAVALWDPRIREVADAKRRERAAALVEQASAVFSEAGDGYAWRRAQVDAWRAAASAR